MSFTQNYLKGKTYFAIITFLFNKYNANLQIMQTDHLLISSESIKENLLRRRKLSSFKVIFKMRSTFNTNDVSRATLPTVTGTGSSNHTLEKHIFKKIEKLKIILSDFERQKKVTKKAFYFYLVRT